MNKKICLLLFLFVGANASLVYSMGEGGDNDGAGAVDAEVVDDAAGGGGEPAVAEVDVADRLRQQNAQLRHQLAQTRQNAGYAPGFLGGNYDPSTYATYFGGNGIDGVKKVLGIELGKAMLLQTEDNGQGGRRYSDSSIVSLLSGGHYPSALLLAGKYALVNGVVTGSVEATGDAVSGTLKSIGNLIVKGCDKLYNMFFHNNEKPLSSSALSCWDGSLEEMIRSLELSIEDSQVDGGVGRGIIKIQDYDRGYGDNNDPLPDQEEPKNNEEDLHWKQMSKLMIKRILYIVYELGGYERYYVSNDDNVIALLQLLKQALIGEMKPNEAGSIQPSGGLAKMILDAKGLTDLGAPNELRALKFIHQLIKSYIHELKKRIGSGLSDSSYSSPTKGFLNGDLYGRQKKRSY